jgi:predicted MFS family arabinose efflux permease
LAATPFEVSVLRVAGHAPALVLGLLAGVWVDRLRRRPILIWSDLGRAALLASIPLAAAFSLLGMEQLYLVALVTGGLGTLFEVAYRSYLPSLVDKDELVEGNAKLTASASVAEVGGFGLAGALVQWLTAPVALLVDAASFVVSAASLALIRRAEPPPTPAEERRSAWREVEEGLRLIAVDPVLRAVSAAKVIGDFAIGGVWASVLLLFILRDLGLEPWLMTATFAVGGVSAFFGALAADRLIRRWGVGRAMIGSTLAYRLTPFLLPLAGGPFGFVLFCLVAMQAADAAATVQDIAETSLVQGTVPDRALGRVNATLRVLGQGAILSGTMIGGVLGELIGLRLTMLAGACLGAVAVLVLLASPLRANRDYAQVT